VSLTRSWYSPGRSWLHRLDPRPKLVFVVLATAVLVTLTGIAPLLAFLVLDLLVLLSAGIPARRLARPWRPLAPLLATIVLLRPLLTPAGAPLLTVGFVRIIPYGLALGLALALRLAAFAFCCYTLLLTTRGPDLVQGLRRVGLPERGEVVVSLALSYPSTLYDVFLTVRDAQRARGLRLEGRGPLARVRALFPVLIAVVAATLHSVERLAMALEARLRQPGEALRHAAAAGAPGGLAGAGARGGRRRRCPRRPPGAGLRLPAATAAQLPGGLSAAAGGPGASRRAPVVIRPGAASSPAGSGQ
jgi:energy-coupling factor transporter transmembrane protein EcfT